MEELIFRYLEGKASEEDKKALLEWLDESPINRKLFISLKQIYIEIVAEISRNTINTDNAYKNFLSRVDDYEKKQKVLVHEKSRKLIHQLRQYAAVAAVALLFGLLGYFMGNGPFNKSDSVKVCEIVVPLGGKSEVNLPDGSKVWLNAGSVFKYDKSFNKKSREVYLSGEAFFTIAKNRRRPFIVHTSYLDVKALGTSFNVKSYPDDNKIETTLVEGKISVESKKDNKSYILIPKQKLTYFKPEEKYQNSENSQANVNQKPEISKELSPANNSEGLIQQEISINKNVNTKESTSWIKGDLIINKETLEELAKKLERKYNISFVFETDALKEYTYSGTLKDFPLEQVLKAIEMTSPVKYSIKEKTVRLSYNKNFKLLN